MASVSRDRVGVDLRGIGDAVRAAAHARQSTVAAFAREALVEALGRPSTLPQGIATEFGRAEIVKLTLRLREHEAEALILNAARLGLSYGEYVARLVRQTPLPMPVAERAADREALLASSDNLAALSVDLGTFMRLLRAYFSDRGRLFQADRGRRNCAIGDALGKRASSGLNISQSSTISLKRAVVGPVIGLGFEVG